MGLDRPLSTLEATVLGIALKSGPFRAHSIVTTLAGSQTLAYQSGAGSIYPLLKRLSDAGLLSLDRRRYSLTDEGRSTLGGWLTPPFALCTNLDTLRSRAYFLSLLSRRQVDAFVLSALAELEALLAHSENFLEEQRRSGDLFGELAALGAVRETEARIAWMREMGNRLMRR